MKKALSLISLVLVGVLVLSSTAFAVTPQWKNVFATTPHISQADDLYASTIAGFSGTTKMDRTLVLYGKGVFGFPEADCTNDIYNEPDQPMNAIGASFSIALYESLLEE